jgi:glycosyltransferase involved in cell wall biosynthesis
MLTNAIAPDKLGGLERYVRELSAALVSLGLPVTVVSKRLSATDEMEETGTDGVRIHRHRVPDKRRWTFALQYPAYVSAGVIHQLRSRPPGALVHCHYPLTTLPLVCTPVPYLYTFHAPVHKEVLAERGGSYSLPRPVQRTAVAGVRIAEQSVTARAKRTVVLSEFMRSELRELSPGAADGSQLIAGGIDTDHFSPGPAERPPWSRCANPLLFSARRLTLRTGVLELVQAMPAVLERWPEARLAIAGEGHQREAITDSLRRSGLEGRVVLLGRLGDTDLRNWYRVADLTITPSQNLEGFGLSTAESLAVGTPALVTPAGANPEVVRGLHPLLVTSGCRSEDLAAAICRVLEQPGLLRGLRSSARAQVHPRWSWTSVATRYLELYESMGT